MITLSNVFVKKFRSTILRNISFSIHKGQIVSIIGHNGSGKSTLCKVLIGAIKPSSGKLFKNKNIKVSYVPQIFESNILIPLKVKDFLLLGIKKSSSTQFTTYLKKLVGRLELSNILNSNLNVLSGGEMQTILLIKALIRHPDLLVLDEAFSFLDLTTLLKLHSIIFEEQKVYGFSIILISHDIDFVIKNTNYVICLQNGIIHCQGDCSSIKDTTYIKDFIGKYIHKNESVQL